jgi:hypothetical protein
MVQFHSQEDKLPSYALLARIHLDRKCFMEAYTLCQKTLTELGEEIPKSLQSCQISEMIEATSRMLKRISDSDLLKMKEMDERLSITMNFYSILSIVLFFGKREMLPFVACRMTQLTLESGLCKHSIFGFILYAMVLCMDIITKKDIDGASGIGKVAMSCSRKRYHTSEQLPQTHVVTMDMLLLTLNLYNHVLTCSGKDLMVGASKTTGDRREENQDGQSGGEYTRDDKRRPSSDAASAWWHENLSKGQHPRGALQYEDGEPALHPSQTSPFWW